MHTIEATSKALLDDYAKQVLKVLNKYPGRFKIHPDFLAIDADNMALPKNKTYVEDLLKALEVLAKGGTFPAVSGNKRLPSTKWFEMHPSSPTKLVYNIRDDGIVYLRLFGYTTVVTGPMNTVKHADKDASYVAFKDPKDHALTKDLEPDVIKKSHSVSTEKLNGILNMIKRTLVYDIKSAEELAISTISDNTYDDAALQNFKREVDKIIKNLG
jgi:hypothetical protein